MIRIKVTGSYRKTEEFLQRAQKLEIKQLLEKYGEAGIKALINATPKRTGKTSRSWIYNISMKKGRYSIEWTNTNENDRVLIAILIQYGHGTRTGGYVQGVDYINPAMKEIFENFARELVEEVKRL